MSYFKLNSERNGVLHLREESPRVWTPNSVLKKSPRGVLNWKEGCNINCTSDDDWGDGDEPVPPLPVEAGAIINLTLNSGIREFYPCPFWRYSPLLRSTIP